MKFICSKERLLENINIVSKAVSSKTTNDILKCIYIDVTKGFFKLTANDLELGIETKPIECMTYTEGSICIDARLFFDIIKHLPNDNVSIAFKDNNTCIIKSGKSEFKILSLASDEFPIMPLVEKDNRFEINANVFKSMIKNTIFSVSVDESKPAFTGVLFNIQNDVISLVSVDGFRISLRTSKVNYSTQNSKIIIPARTLNEISKLLTDDEIINVYLSDKHILFETKTFTIVSRIIEGEFLNYDQVITSDYDTMITINRVDFINSLERTSIVSKEIKKHPINLNINKESIILTSMTEIGTTYDEISIKLEGDDLEIAFNPKYLIDILKAIEQDYVNLYFTTPLSPCIIKGVDSTDHKYLILPLRTKG